MFNLFLTNTLLEIFGNIIISKPSKLPTFCRPRLPRPGPSSPSWRTSGDRRSPSPAWIVHSRQFCKTCIKMYIWKQQTSHFLAGALTSPCHHSRIYLYLRYGKMSTILGRSFREWASLKACSRDLQRTASFQVHPCAFQSPPRPSCGFHHELIVSLRRKV